MGTASFAQTSFLGGEWSPQMQGRFDLPDYRTGMNLCKNIIPIEEGSAPRRSGTRLGGVTRSGNYGVLREYNVDQDQPYDIELTAGFLRLWKAGADLVTEPGTAVTNISSAASAVFTSAAHGLVTGDQVIFTLGAATSYAGIAQILGRQLSVTKLTTSTFRVVDALTGATIAGSLIDFSDLTTLIVFKIFEIETTYIEADLQQIRIVQDGADALLLHNSYAPQTLTITTNPDGAFVTATLTPTSFYDGPYLDIPTDGTTLTPNALSGFITFTASAITSINGGHGLLSSDVGRMFRIFSEPAVWAAATAYVTGDHVKEADVYWKAVQASTGKQPSTDAGIYWVIDTTAAVWTWGTISAVSSATVFVGSLHAAVTYPENTAGGNLLYTTPAVAWQLGAYCETTGYPAVGAYYQGRVWLGGAIKNRFDACVSNDFAQNGHINFAPTGRDGTVADNSGISGTLNATEIENFLWMLPDEQGIIAGTQGGEWVIASSASGEPITPTSILTREMTHYGSLNTPAIKVGRATIFAHRDTRKVYEYMANYFTQKYVAENLSLKAKHLTVGGVAEIAYMRELTPVIWVRLSDGGLIGCTYKHDDPIKPLEFAGWHQHELGTGRNVISIQGGPANGGQTDTLSMVTQDPVTDFCYVEFLQTLWDDGDDLLTAWYVDGGIKVAAAARINSTLVRLYGLWYMIGEEVTVWGAGLDLGDFTVAADGTIDIPLNSADSLFTDAHLAAVTALGCTSLSTEILAGGDDASTVYIMTAEENYDPTHVASIAALTTYVNTFINTDQNYPGVQWDPVRRNLMYMYTENTPSSALTNTTGHVLWNGNDTIALNGAIDPSVQKNSSVCVKNIDTGEVNFYVNYNVANVVPNGIGGSDGTYRRFTQDFLADGTYDGSAGNGPGMTDPYTGNFWINSQSCPLYMFRLEDNYSQIISPLQPAFSSDFNDVMMVGFTNSGATSPWTFAREVDAVTTLNTFLYLIPRLITAEETSADVLLKYATYTYPTTERNTYYHAYNREVFDHAGNMYLFSCTSLGGKNFRLYKFSPPTAAAYPSAAVGGGFTEITPWGAATGPNADGPTYTLRGGNMPDPAFAPNKRKTADVIPMYLPVTNDLVLIEKFFPNENTADSLDPALMFWSCTYVHSPNSGPTWDHHASFVTGYMTAAWAPTTAANAAYAVSDAFEVNAYLGQSDYLYDIDYTKRWFFFVCTKMVDGASLGKPRIVLVEYSFVYGSAPSVVQVIDEQGWDDAYPNYAPKSSDAYAPYSSVDTPAVAVSMATLFSSDPLFPQWDIGLHDPETNTFWWSGGGTDTNLVTPYFCTFDPRFANRMQTGAGTPGGSLIAATPPFMKLSFGLGYCAPFAVGHTYCSQGQILRAVSPQESLTQTGPSLGKYRRTTDAMPLLVDTQGMSMGVDFLDMRPLQFKSTGGTVNLTLSETFSGVYKGQVDADSNFNNLWCWEVCRPYPCTVVAVEIQHKTNENS